MSDIRSGLGLEFLEESYGAIRNYNDALQFNNALDSEFSRWLVKMAWHAVEAKAVEFDRLVRRMDIDPQADLNKFMADSQ